jgi:hypothetical protein
MAWGWVRSFWWTGLAWVGLGLALPASCFFLPSKKNGENFSKNQISASLIFG